MKIETVLKQLEGNVWDTTGLKSSSTSVNWDYPFDGQCVSLIKAYFNKLYGKPLSFGNAIDYYNNMHTNGILKYCKWITSNPQNGDIAVTHCYIDWGNGEIIDYGHVMIYWDGQYLSQNVNMNDGRGANPKAIRYYNYWSATIIGWFRPIIKQEEVTTEEELMKLAGTTFSFDIYADDGKTLLKTFVFDDGEFYEVEDKDELNIVKEIYKGVHGKDMVHKKWQTNAPWYARLWRIVKSQPVKQLL